jgi:hypothetical protein
MQTAFQFSNARLAATVAAILFEIGLKGMQERVFGTPIGYGG